MVKMDELEIYIKQNELDVVGVTESWTTEQVWDGVAIMLIYNKQRI